MFVCLLVYSIDQFSEVVRHHIEAGAKLQNELVLVWSDLYCVFFFISSRNIGRFF